MPPQMARAACKLLLPILVCALLLPAAAAGQSARGTLLVAVEDSVGGRIAGAGVTVTLEKLGVSRSANTDERGEARFESLPPGMYSIAVHASGFGEKTSRVAVAVSSQATFAVILGPQALKQSIQVRDRGPSLASQPVETTSSTINTVVTAEDLDEIPLSARSFANIALLAPFTALVEPSDPTKARITAVAFGGDRKSTRLNSSHDQISYAVFCLNKKKKKNKDATFHKKKKKSKKKR